jgi:hypothetical protein
MELMLLIGLSVFALLVVVIALIAFAGWVAKNFFGKSDSWLDYGIDEDDLL